MRASVKIVAFRIMPVVTALAILPCTYSHALTIQHVSHTPTHLSFDKHKIVNVRFALDEDAQVSLKIYDDRDVLIRTVNGGSLKKGDASISWDGKDDKGKRVPTEAYHYTVEASTGGKSVIHDVTDLLSKNASTVRNLEWDKNKGEVRYILGKASRVTIRIGIDEGGPLLANVINWLPRQRGKHIEKWKGVDASNDFDIRKIEKARVVVNAYTFASNTIIVGKSLKASKYIKIANPVMRDRKRVSKKMFNNAGKLALDRIDYDVTIDLPTSKTTKKGVPVYKGVIPVKISVPKDDLDRLYRDRFEPILYVDGQYVSELETGFFPVTWHLDTSTFKTGNHFITVNLRGYDGQYGATSLNFYVEN
jgi:hypothetical protein